MIKKRKKECLSLSAKHHFAHAKLLLS